MNKHQKQNTTKPLLARKRPLDNRYLGKFIGALNGNLNEPTANLGIKVILFQ